MATPQEWWQGARPRTLPAAVAPVAAGTGVAAYYSSFDAMLALLALVVALAFQVAVNFANDYSDGVRGTDDERVGPMRLTATGVAAPEAVKRAAGVSFGVGAFAGLAIVALTAQWWLLAVGAACIAAAWYYTGGRTPYGYRGLGEVSVFVFFGLVATMGTAYIQTEQWTWLALVVACGVGALAVALLVVNNLRDIPTDAAVGKQTLAVRLGDRGTRVLYVALTRGSPGRRRRRVRGLDSGRPHRPGGLYPGGAADRSRGLGGVRPRPGLGAGRHRPDPADLRPHPRHRSRPALTPFRGHDTPIRNDRTICTTIGPRA